MGTRVFNRLESREERGSRLLGHFFYPPVDYGATFSSAGKIAEPLFFARHSIIGPHFFPKKRVGDGPASRESISPSVGSPGPRQQAFSERLAAVGTRLRGHKMALPRHDYRARFSPAHTNTGPQLLESWATKIAGTPDYRATFPRLRSHKNLSKQLNQLENPAPNLKTLCSYKKNKTGSACLSFLETV